MHCKPGVVNKSKSKGLLLEYGLLWNREDQQQSYFMPADDDQDKSEVYEIMTFKLKAPVYYSKKNGAAVILGFKHQREQFRFQNFLVENILQNNPIYDEVLIRSHISLNAYKSLSNKRYLAFRGQIDCNGDYKQFVNFHSNYSTYKIGLIYGIKNRPDKELGIGLTFSRGLRRSIAYPFVVYNRTINERWGLETILPVRVMGRYNVNDNNILLFGAEFNSREFFLGLADGSGFENDFIMTRQEVRLQVTLEKKLTSWFWMSCKGGYLNSLGHRFQELEPVGIPSITRISPGNSLFFKAGIFLSPPK